MASTPDQFLSTQSCQSKWAIESNKETIAMPKTRTHKAAAKRFKRGGSEKLRRTRGGGRAGGGYVRRRSKRSKRKKSSTAGVANRSEVKRVERLAPYLKKK
jgi:large subunit ribosomal protein L35